MSARTAHRDWELAYQALTYAGDLLMQRADAARRGPDNVVSVALLYAAGALYSEAAAVIGKPSLAEACAAETARAANPFAAWQREYDARHPALRAEWERARAAHQAKGDGR